MFRLWPRHAATQIAVEKGDQVTLVAVMDAPDGDEVAHIAARVTASGMAAPVSMLLRILRPLHWLGGQALYVAQPFLEALTNPRVKAARVQHEGDTRRTLGIAGIARLLEEEGGVDRLLARLEKTDRKGGSGGPG